MHSPFQHFCRPRSGADGLGHDKRHRRSPCHHLHEVETIGSVEMTLEVSLEVTPEVSLEVTPEASLEVTLEVTYPFRGSEREGIEDGSKKKET